MALESFHALLDQITDRPLASLSVILNLIIIESLLSIDNAAVLATMVLDLPKEQRKKALRYGILGAYVFRGIALIFAAVLIRIWWFKPLGGLYLLVLALRWFFRPKKQEEPNPEEQFQELKQQKRSWLYRRTLGALGPFWATVLMVELMDVAFSIDNVIAANAYSKNIILIWTGVFIGILSMRLVAQGFVRLLEKYPFLETCAFLVIGLLGVKLLISGYSHFFPCSAFAIFMEGPNECLLHRNEPIPEGEHPMVWGDIITSVLSLCIFFIPVATSLLFNWPRHRNVPEERDPS
jgi:YkoY family integral membrane protein